MIYSEYKEAIRVFIEALGYDPSQVTEIHMRAGHNPLVHRYDKTEKLHTVDEVPITTTGQNGPVGEGE